MDTRILGHYLSAYPLMLTKFVPLSWLFLFSIIIITVTHLGRFLVNLDVPLHRRRSRGRGYVAPPKQKFGGQRPPPSHTHVLVPKNTFTDVVDVVEYL